MKVVFRSLALGLTVAMALGPSAAMADKWESSVNGAKAHDEVVAILDYKKAQARKVEEVFYGLRDRLYVVSPTSKTRYTNNFLTPTSVNYTVRVESSFDAAAVAALYAALRAAQGNFSEGENEVKIKFPQDTVVLKIYDEIYPTYQRLVRGGYAFEARAVLLDKEQTVIASSDNSLLLSVVETSNGGLDFSTSPLLRTYTKAEAPDLSGLLSDDGSAKPNPKLAELEQFFGEPAYRLSFSNDATFYSLPVTALKDVASCRVLRDSDQLLVYKRDKK